MSQHHINSVDTVSKKAYHKPGFQKFGNVSALTNATIANDNSNPDGVTNPFVYSS